MIELGPCEIAGVFGPVASGKTYLIGQWLKTQPRYVRFDVTGETIDTKNLEHVWHAPGMLYRRLNDPKLMYFFNVSYHPGTELEVDFYQVLRVVWRLPVHKLIVCDEFHEVCSVYDTPKYVRTMLRYARHDHLAIIGASQRIADVSKLFTASCRMVVLFWTQEARDLQAISDRWGTKTAEMVRSLRPLIFDDVRKICTQVPQCVVCTKMAAPYVYDFTTGKTVEGEENEDESRTDVGEETRDESDSFPDRGAVGDSKGIDENSIARVSTLSR